MTLSTDVLIEGKIRPQDVFWFCRRNLLELADDEGTWADEITYFWSKDKSASPPEDHPWQIHNHLGQGFPAILSVEYRPSGEPLRTEEDFHRHDEYCNIPGNPEFHDPNEELCDGEHNYQRPCYLKVNFDTGTATPMNSAEGAEICTRPTSVSWACGWTPRESPSCGRTNSRGSSTVDTRSCPISETPERTPRTGCRTSFCPPSLPTSSPEVWMPTYAPRLKKDLDVLERHVVWSIDNEAALTITYREFAKDPVTGKRVVARIPEHQEYDTIIRTVEPYDIEVNATGDLYMRTLDRVKRAPRSYRLDRVLMYTTHPANSRVLDHQVQEAVATNA